MAEKAYIEIMERCGDQVLWVSKADIHLSGDNKFFLALVGFSRDLPEFDPVFQLRGLPDQQTNDRLSFAAEFDYDELVCAVAVHPGHFSESAVREAQEKVKVTWLTVEELLEVQRRHIVEYQKVCEDLDLIIQFVKDIEFRRFVYTEGKPRVRVVILEVYR